MPPQNRVQAMFPRGSVMIPNPHGSAPGIHQSFPRSGAEAAQLFALPGVPAEMREMWEETVRPTLLNMLGMNRRVLRHRCIKCFGVGESDLESMLPDLIRRGRSPTVGITVSDATITLRITAEGESEDECEALIEPTVATINKCLGPLVFGAEEDELQHAVVRMLAAKELTVSTIEWGPGGLLANWLSEVDPYGRTFRGGSIVRSDDALRAMAGDVRGALEPSEVTRLVADATRNTRQRFGTDIALGVGPFPAVDAPAPAVSLVLDTDVEVLTRQVTFAGHPQILKVRCAKQALDLVRLSLG
jgi:nicotinamide-nucleotide amidase